MTSDELSSQHREAREPLYTTDVHAFLAQDITLVVEAASQAVCREIAPQVLVLVAGKDLMPMSVGAFADESFLQQMRDLAREHGRCVYLPSGAIGGLDALSAGAIDELDEVVLTTTKPPHALERASMEQDVDLTTITEPTCIYDGPAIEAVPFPKNVSVAAALSLAGGDEHGCESWPIQATGITTAWRLASSRGVHDRATSARRPTTRVPVIWLCERHQNVEESERADTVWRLTRSGGNLRTIGPGWCSQRRFCAAGVRRPTVSAGLWLRSIYWH